MTSFVDLKAGHVVGIVTQQGMVLSEFTGTKMKHHEELWHGVQHCNWRWCNSQSIWSASRERYPSEEQYDAIMSHMSKKYGLRWFENGHHDWKYLDECIKKESRQSRK